MRKTKVVIKVAQVLMADPDEHHWGFELGRVTGIRSGVMYPILRRFMDAGWIEDGWEDPRTIKGRPPRRYYSVTPEGLEALGALAMVEERIA